MLNGAAAILDILDELNRTHAMEVTFAPLTELTQWRYDKDRGEIARPDRKFFRITGIDVQAPGAVVSSWAQPVIDQPEVGILGFLVRRVNGSLHVLIQAKIEPGNPNGFQISPTVQATRSNFTRAHNGRSVPYLEYFVDPPVDQVIADTLQSEQAAWFLGKRNRNMVVEVAEEVTALDGFFWVDLPGLYRLLDFPELVNMDARSVMACFPRTDAEAGPDSDSRGGNVNDVLAWLAAERKRHSMVVSPIPLDSVTGWEMTDGVLTHKSGRFFEILGVDVRAASREVGQWSQPMLRQCGSGVIAFLMTRINGVPYVLAHAKAKPGYLSSVGLEPTVCCAPDNYTDIPYPEFLEDVLTATPDQIIFDNSFAEEGGRFFHTSNRYVIIETDDTRTRPGFHWVSYRQLSWLVRHGDCVSVEARTLLACLHAVVLAERDGSVR